MIGADGVNSFVAKQLFGSSFDQNKIGFALEVELPKGTHKYAQPSIHFNVVNWGFGWVFPKKHSDTFGIVGLHRLNAKLKDQLQNSLIRLAFRKLFVSENPLNYIYTSIPVLC